MTTKNWQLLNQVINGNCLEVMKQIEDQSVDMILCDLPYGTTQNKWDSVIPFSELWVTYKRLIRPDGAIVLTASQPFTSTLTCSNLNAFKYSWVWEKGAATGHLNAKKMPMKLHEDILVFSYKPHRYFPQDLVPFNKVTRRGNNGSNFGKSGCENFQAWTNYPRSILRYPVEGKPQHPTQKPVALFEYLIKTYSNPGETILDNCLGSGTTAVAAINTDRNFIGIELDPGYCEIARNRIETAKQSKLNLE